MVTRQWCVCVSERQAHTAVLWVPGLELANLLLQATPPVACWAEAGYFPQGCVCQHLEPLLSPLQETSPQLQARRGVVRVPGLA